MDTGILLVNLGSPDSTSVKDVRKYLGEFLMDENVIDSPYLIRSIIVKGFILPFRPKKSAEAYQTIWWPEGSPLKVISERVKNKLQQRINVPVEMAMRYANPSIESGIEKLLNRAPALRKIFLVPLYPHYAMSSIKSVVDKTKEVMQQKHWNFQLHIQPPFYKEPAFISALSGSIQPYLKDQFDHILFSYHGLPERQIRKTDPTRTHCLNSPDCCEKNSEAHAFCYRHQCFETTEKVAQILQLEKGKYSVSFQSRLGRDPWLLPDTAQVLTRLPAEGHKRIAVVCPAFVSDCLETLEEIAIRGKESFLASGGEYFIQVPCLNESDPWIDVLESYCRRFLSHKPLKS